MSAGMPTDMRAVRPPLCVVTAILAVAIFVPAVWADAPMAQPAGVRGASALEGDLLARLNGFRAARGLRPFRSSPRLHAAAVRHSNEMAQYGYFDHASPRGAAFWRRIAGFYRPAGYRRWTVGENLEYGQPGLAAVEVVQDWLASPPHRANVVSTRFRDAGVGVVYVPSAPGVFGGMPTTIVTLDVGFRSR